MAQLIVLQGPPASGKSTWAKKWQKKDIKNRVIVSRDAIRHGRGRYWIPQQEGWITDIEHFMIRSALERGYDVAIDATNLNPAIIQIWEDIAKETGAEIYFKLMEATLEECKDRNKNPDREHVVPDETIEKFYRKYMNYAENFKQDHNQG